MICMFLNNGNKYNFIYSMTDISYCLSEKKYHGPAG